MRFVHSLGLGRAPVLLVGPLFLLSWSGAAAAQVVEPNGVLVPGPSNPPGEESLQDYFDMLTPPEPIDAVKDASPEPGTFSPLCGFQAELVMSKSNASAGLYWYNVPSSPTDPPSAIYQLIAETNMPGAMVSSATIRGDSHYAGGLVGFALTKTFDNGVTHTPIYFSEYMRNKFCTACSGDGGMPGYWKMMLAYPSKIQANTYFLAFEDWEGADQNSWQGNDGDFNDKVFRLTGVRCPGGGDPCDTGKLGLCARGITECRTNAPLACKQLVAETPEKCDGIDNDCNGMVDDGDNLCRLGAVCEHGTCVAACGSGEFVCAAGYVCNGTGHCVEAACANKDCDPGTVCRGGACVAPCDGVVCPPGQECTLGVCTDPCAGVTCDQGRVCRGGACVEPCDCAGCPAGLACNAQTGRCVDPGCENLSCADGMVCAKGACVDPCEGVRCPGGAACSQGVCPAPTVEGSDAGANSTGSTGGITIVTGMTGSSSGDSAGGAGSSSSSAGAGNTSAGSSQTGGVRGATTGNGSSGCSCETAGASSRAGRYWACVALVGLLAARARRRRSSRPWA